MLILKNISFIKDNKTILNNINLTIEDNKFYCITGPNGSGKSTLAKIIMGIEKPTNGRIIFNNEDITNLSIDKRAKLGIGFAFQQPIVFKGITVYDILKLATGKDLNRQIACSILSKVGLCAKEYLDRELNNTLSGGELKRIEIASLIARQPKVSIFDEPEAGIDLWSFKYLTEIFKKINEREKGTTIIISHQEKILDSADEIILLEAGKIINKGKKDKVLPNIMNNKCKKGDQNE